MVRQINHWSETSEQSGKFFTPRHLVLHGFQPAPSELQPLVNIQRFHDPFAFRSELRRRLWFE
jgi:hypothetical protein